MYFVKIAYFSCSSRKKNNVNTRALNCINYILNCLKERTYIRDKLTVEFEYTAMFSSQQQTEFVCTCLMIGLYGF